MDYSFRSLRTMKKVKVSPKTICVRAFANEGDASEWFIFDAMDNNFDCSYNSKAVKQKREGRKSGGRGDYCGRCLHGNQYCHHRSSDNMYKSPTQEKLMPVLSCQVTRFASWAVLLDSHLYCVGCYAPPCVDEGRKLHINDDVGKPKNKVFIFNLNVTSPWGLHGSDALPDTLTSRKAPHVLVLGGLLYVVGGVYVAHDDDDNDYEDNTDSQDDDDKPQTRRASDKVSNFSLSMEESRADAADDDEDDDEPQTTQASNKVLNLEFSMEEPRADEEDEKRREIQSARQRQTELLGRGKVSSPEQMDITDSVMAPSNGSAMSAVGDDGLLQHSWIFIRENSNFDIDENYMNHKEVVVTKSQPWAEVFNPQRGAWEGLPEPPGPLSEGYGSGFICAVIEVDKAILVGSAKDSVLYSYSPNTGSWSMLRGHDLDPSCFGQAVVVDRTLFWFTTLGYLKAYDLNKKKWYEGMVDGSWDSEILGTYRFIPGLVHIESNVFCLIWADTEISFTTVQSQQSHLHCLKFEVDFIEGMDGLGKGSLTLSIRSCHSRPIDHGITLVDCQVL